MIALTWSHHATARLRERYQDDTAAAQGRLESLLELGRIACSEPLPDDKVKVTIEDRQRRISLVIADTGDRLVVITVYLQGSASRRSAPLRMARGKAHRDRRATRAQHAQDTRTRRHDWTDE